MTDCPVCYHKPPCVRLTDSERQLLEAHAVESEKLEPFGVKLTPDDAAIFFGLCRIDGSDIEKG